MVAVRSRGKDDGSQIDHPLALGGLRRAAEAGRRGVLEEPPKELLFPFTDGNCLTRHEDTVVSRLRKRLAEVFEKPVNHRFFGDQYLPGEDPNAALLRLFKLRQWMVSLTDEQTIEAMAKGK